MSERISDDQYSFRTMIDCSNDWARAGYPPVAVGRYRDAAYEIKRLRDELQQHRSGPDARDARRYKFLRHSTYVGHPHVITGRGWERPTLLGDAVDAAIDSALAGP